MADEVAPMEFKVLAEISQAMTSLTRIQDEIKQTATHAVQGQAQVQKSAERVTLSLKSMAEAAGVFAAMDFLKSAMKQAEDSAADMAVLDQSIKNVGGSLKAFHPVVNNVEVQMRSLGFANNDTASAIARLTQMLHNPAKALNLVGLAANLARARQIDLASAATIVGRAASGSVALLSKYGIATKDAAGHTLSAQKAIEGMERSFRGVANTYANTTSGQMAKFRADLSDAKGKVGDAVMPIVSMMLPALVSMANLLSNYVTPALHAVAKLMSEHKTLFTALAIAIGAYVIGMKAGRVVMMAWKEAATALKIIQLAWLVLTKELTLAESGLNAVMEANPIGLIIGLIAALAAGLIYAYKHSQKFRDIVNTAFHDVERVVGVVCKNIIEGAIKPMVTGFLTEVRWMVTGANKVLSTFGIHVLDGAQKAIEDFSATAIHDIGAVGNALGQLGNDARSAGAQIKLVGGDPLPARLLKKTTGGTSDNYNIQSNYASGLSDVVKTTVKHHAALKKHHAAHHAGHLAALAAHHRALLAAERAHAKAMEAARKAAAAAREAALKKQLDAEKALYENALIQLGLLNAKRNDLEIVNGQVSNVGTSLLNIGAAPAAPPPPVVVNVAGSVVTQQQLTGAITQGILVTQRTNATTGIK